MKGRWVAAALGVALAAATEVPAKPKPPKPAKAPVAVPGAVAPHVLLTKTPDGDRADLIFDGPLWGWAAPRLPDGRRELDLLVGPAETSRAGPTAECTVQAVSDSAPPASYRLFRWRPDAPEVLSLVASGLPAGALEAADLDGSGGADTLLLVRPGAIDELRAAEGGTVVAATIVTDGDLGQKLGDPRLAGGVPGDRALRQAVVGSFRSWTRRSGGGVRVASSVDLPIEVDPGQGSTRAMSPDVLPVGRGASGRTLYATSPQPVGYDRVRTFLLDADAQDDPRSLECWGQFPERERLLENGFAILDGRPVLVAMTISADKLSLFGGKRLRVFPLGGDRTRAGGAPLLATETDVNLWQVATPFVLDLDGDGRDDLVLGYWKGLKSTIATLEIHRRNPDGSFGKPKTLEVDVTDGDTGFLDFGRDLDGDHRPDLVVIGAGALRIYPGRPAAEAASRPFETHPSRTIPLATDRPGAAARTFEFRVSTTSLSIGRSGDGFGDPRFVDFDGDGRPEVLFVEKAGGGGRASVVFIRGASRPE